MAYINSQTQQGSVSALQSEVWSMMPLFILIMVLSMVMRIVVGLTQPEVLKEIAKGVTIGALA